MVEVFRRPSIFARSLRRGPADLDPAHDDVRGPLDAVGQPGVIDVDHRRADARAGVRRGDSRAHQARADHADPLHGARLTVGSSTPGSRESRFFMKKTAIRFAEIGEPTSSTTASARP